MLQRLRDAIDSRITEEQARQRSYQASPSRANTSTTRPVPRNGSPSKRAGGSSAPRGRKDGEPLRKGPDPSEFESTFAIEEEELPARSGTPRPAKSKEDSSMTKDTKDTASDTNTPGEDDKASTGVEPPSSQDLPTEVRVKLRKLEKLESKYQELLKSYRVAHARVLTIEPFEAALRETTPLTSISDPAALVEYLNQVNLKGDMVVDELKRVSTERDKFKEELGQAKDSAKNAWHEVSNLRSQSKITGLIGESGRNSGESQETAEVLPNSHTDDDSPIPTTKSPSKSRTGSVTSLSIFSPRSKPVEAPTVPEEKGDLFSYDEELPRMKMEIQQHQETIDGLRVEVKNLTGDLTVARESTQSMVQTLEESSRELHALRELKERADVEYEEKQVLSEKSINQLKADLQLAEEKLTKIAADHRECDPKKVEDLESRLIQAEQELDNARSESKLKQDASEKVQQLTNTIRDMEAEKRDLLGMQEEYKQCEKRINTLNSLVKTLRSQLSDVDDSNSNPTKNGPKSQSNRSLQDDAVSQKNITSITTNSSEVKASDTPLNTDGVSVGKKKNKKKKKGGKSSSSANTDTATKPGEEQPHDPVNEEESAEDRLALLELEVGQLRVVLDERESVIERLHGKLKDQDEFREEIESLRDDLVNLGQEHVEAKDRVKDLVAEKDHLQSTIRRLEQEITNLQNRYDLATSGAEEKQKDLATDFQDLKVKATALQTDLSAAQQLASSRFKDLTEMKGILQRARPELIALRSEVADLNTVKGLLGQKEAELERLDSKHEQMRVEVTKLGQIVTERDTELKLLNQKLREEVNNKTRAEDRGNKVTQELQRLEIEKQQVTQSLDQLSKDLARSQEDLTASKALVRELEHEVSKINRDNENLKDDITLKTAQHASAQSLMTNMRDQTAEMAMQMKEARDRCESLDEEVAEAHRLLGERSREGETMRRLLADVQGRADARTREMKERMDTAIEERDRAEEEASTAGRRKARELEELRNRLRETERGLKRAEADKEELENAQRDWRRRRDELEQESTRYNQEGDEVRKAMGELRDALDESERQARDLEKQKAEMRRSLEEMQHRLEKLQKSNKAMADEIRGIQIAKTQRAKSDGHSSRSSTEHPSRHELLDSPTPKSAGSSAALANGPNGHVPTPIDYVYLKNVLLQFLEQKDKKHQMQLIPVLGMLLHFDRKDEQKWMSTIVAK